MKSDCNWEIITYFLFFQIEEHRICVCVRKRPLNKQGESWAAWTAVLSSLTLFVFIKTEGLFCQQNF